MKSKLLLIMSFIFVVFACEEEDQDKIESFKVTDYDGNVYETIEIGDQIWMAENLNTTHYADGTEIQLVEDSTSLNNLNFDDKAMCYYDNSTNNAYKYGALYTWSAAMNGSAYSNENPSNIQGVCPDGWHLPSDSEWKQLEMYLGMSQADADDYGRYRGTNEGSKLSGNKELWSEGLLVNDTDFGSSGFKALPAGSRNFDGSFNNLGNLTYFWSTSEYDNFPNFASARRIFYDNNGIHSNYLMENKAYSVRCIKD